MNLYQKNFFMKTGQRSTHNRTFMLDECVRLVCACMMQNIPSHSPDAAQTHMRSIRLQRRTAAMYAFYVCPVFMENPSQKNECIWRAADSCIQYNINNPYEWGCHVSYNIVSLFIVVFFLHEKVCLYVRGFFKICFMLRFSVELPKCEVDHDFSPIVDRSANPLSALLYSSESNDVFFFKNLAELINNSRVVATWNAVDASQVVLWTR